MAKEVIMRQKKEVFVESIKNSINLYLNKNADVLGFCHVREVDMANDFKTAKVFIEFLDNENSAKKIDIIRKSKDEIFREYNKMYSSRYFPSIKYYNFTNELNF